MYCFLWMRDVIQKNIVLKNATKTRSPSTPQKTHQPTTWPPNPIFPQSEKTFVDERQYYSFNLLLCILLSVARGFFEWMDTDACYSWNTRRMPWNGCSGYDESGQRKGPNPPGYLQFSQVIPYFIIVSLLSDT